MHRSCFRVSSSVLSSNLGAHGNRSWSSHFWMITRDGPFFSHFFAWRIVVSENLTLIPNFSCSRRTDFLWGSSWDTQLFWILSFNLATDLFAPPFFDFYWAAHQPQCVWNDTCHHTCIRIQTCNLGIREDALNLMEIPCTFLPKSFDTYFCLSIPKESLLVESDICKAFFLQSESAPSK